MAGPTVPNVSWLRQQRLLLQRVFQQMGSVDGLERSMTRPNRRFGALQAASGDVFAAKKAKSAPGQAKPSASLLSDGSAGREAPILDRSLTIACVLNVKSVFGFFTPKLPWIYRHKWPHWQSVAISIRLVSILFLAQTLYHSPVNRRSVVLPALLVGLEKSEYDGF